MNTTHYILGIAAASILLAGCGLAQTNTPATSTQPSSQNEVERAGSPKTAEEKKGDTTITGTVSKVGEKYFITAAGQQPKEIESYLVKLDDYVGKNVTIVGQYSGDTLFVGKVQ